ncbi:hypothetical protein Glove_203g49 [Diversispora epigaea]|uniref:UBC core domain-containing protein n=1 Tax=Diversispora epigaea TaxID=1348612 RepID=A0A397ISR0_9GLOM|nr:hypothetical protein Glove_203g49 [Diversispora epigaea]
MQTTTSFYRLSGSGLKNNQRDDEGNDERGGYDGERYPKPLFKDECFRRMELMIEFTNLRNPKHCPSGVYVMPSADNFYTWYGVLFVHKGYYKNERIPAVQFILDLINNEVPFHPLIDQETGNFSLSQQFKDWAPHKYYIFHILHYLKKSFKKGVLDNLSKKHCPNEKAFTTYKENPKQFENMAKQCSKLSISETVLYDNQNDLNPIQFSKLSDDKIGELKAFISLPLTERERPNHSSRRTYSTSSINSFVPQP